MILLLIAIITAMLGFGGAAGVVSTIAKWLAIIFIVLFIIIITSRLSRNA